MSNETQINLTRQDAEKKIALRHGAKWFICHKSANGSHGFLCFPKGYSGLYANEEIADALPEGYHEASPEIGDSPFADANASKRLRDELAELGWLVESMRNPNTRVGTVFRAVDAEDTREVLVEGEELEAVVALYLECITGERHYFISGLKP